MIIFDKLCYYLSIFFGGVSVEGSGHETHLQQLVAHHLHAMGIVHKYDGAGHRWLRIQEPAQHLQGAHSRYRNQSVRDARW